MSIPDHPLLILGNRHVPGYNRPNCGRNSIRNFITSSLYQTQNSCHLNMEVNTQNNCTTSKGREVTCDVNRPIGPKETMEPRVHIHTSDSQQWLMLSPQTKTGYCTKEIN